MGIVRVVPTWNRLQVLVPPKFGNGHLVLSDVAVFHYKQSSYYNRAGQFTILWNDPKCDFLVAGEDADTLDAR